jgi:SNF2 family DNA or RNA helicase
MLSSEDSVSGINLTQATHVILLHPFWSDKGEDVDLAAEKQGISRAYRFGLNHPLKVVRFAVKDTVEEEITLRRQNIKL